MPARHLPAAPGRRLSPSRRGGRGLLAALVSLAASGGLAGCAGVLSTSNSTSGPRTPSGATLPTAPVSASSATTLQDPCRWLTASRVASLLGSVGKGIDKSGPGTVRNAGGTDDPSCVYSGTSPTRQLVVSRSTQLDAGMANALMTLSFTGTIARLKGVGDRAEHDAAQLRDDGLTVQTLMVRDGNVVTTVSFASKVSVAAYGDHAQQLIAVYRALPKPGS